MRIRSLVAVLGVLLVAGIAYALPSGCEQRLSVKERAPTIYDRVVFIGASASSGYELGPGVSLASVFEDRLAVAHYNISNLADGKFFMKSTAERSAIVDDALTRKPTLVVALDFLFWFAHGVPSDDASRRAAMDEGLGLLDHFSCPLVVGDLPDVSVAGERTPVIRLVLPSRETLTWANERIRQWVSKRNLTTPTLLVPLADAVAAQLAGASLRIGDREYKTDGLLQADRLHPTKDGEVMLSRLVEQALVAGSLSRPGDFK